MGYKYRKNRVYYWLLGLAGIVVAFFLIAACGKNASPLPPAQFKLPVVESLSSELAGNELILTWPIPEWDAPEGIDMAGFNVYRAKVEIKSACDECPARFEKIKAVRLDRLAAEFGSTLEYRELLEEGHQYRYKVAAYTHTGREGEDSPVVKITY